MPDTNTGSSLRSEIVQDIISKVPSWPILWGNTLIFLLILMVLLISWFIKYPDVLEAEALVTTSLPPQKEFSKSSGKIAEIFVRNTDAVRKGQYLAVIENTAIHNDVFWLKEILDTITYDRSGFSFPIDQVPVLFLGEIESSYATFENAYIEYLLNQSHKPFSYDAYDNQKSLVEMMGRLKSLQSQKRLIDEQLELTTKDFQRQKSLFEQGVISEQNFERQNLELLRTTSNAKSIELSISQLKQQINRANTDSQKIVIDRTKSEVKLLKNTIQAFNQLKNQVLAWELKYVFKSNLDGEVLFFDYWHKGQEVKQGDLLFTIIPRENNGFIARLRLPPENAGKIEVNQQVLIELSSYPKDEFGLLKGLVDKIPLIVNEEGDYIIEVSISNELTTTFNEKIDFRNEIAGTAEVITNDIRLIERFFNMLNFL